MAVLFFDSSGLVKRYIAETGTAWVQSITAASAGNDRFIAKITGPEITADFARDFFLLEVSLPCAQEAMTLSARHGLRGYDAVQLAAALFLRDQCRQSNLSDPLLITSDKELIAAAQAEGLAVDNPNLH